MCTYVAIWMFAIVSLTFARAVGSKIPAKNPARTFRSSTLAPFGTIMMSYYYAIA